MSPALATTPVTETGAEFREIRLDALRPSPHNPRRHPSPEDDAQLVESVRAHGILEPLIARPVMAGSVHVFEIVAGHRRFEAAKAAGLATAPVLVRHLDEAQALEIAVIENDQRKDVHPLDEAEAFHRLQGLTQATPADIAAKIGRPVRYVADRLKLLDLHAAQDDSFATVCKAFGIDVKALDKAVAKEQAAKAKSETVPPSKKGAKPVQNVTAKTAGKAAKKR